LPENPEGYKGFILFMSTHNVYDIESFIDCIGLDDYDSQIDKKLQECRSGNDIGVYSISNVATDMGDGASASLLSSGSADLQLEIVLSIKFGENENHFTELIVSEIYEQGQFKSFRVTLHKQVVNGPSLW
jgi:hypothetical protein